MAEAASVRSVRGAIRKGQQYISPSLGGVNSSPKVMQPFIVISYRNANIMPMRELRDKRGFQHPYPIALDPVFTDYEKIKNYKLKHEHQIRISTAAYECRYSRSKREERKVRIMKRFKRKNKSQNDEDEIGIAVNSADYLRNIASKDVTISKPNDAFLILEEHHTLTLEIKGSDQPKITPEFLSNMVERWSVPNEAYLEVCTERNMGQDANGNDLELHVIRFSWVEESKSNTPTKE